MGAAAAEHAQAFSVERHAERVAELYEELLSRGG
jgi:glycosyltransferase involved in cell wall biosynthesis